MSALRARLDRLAARLWADARAECPEPGPTAIVTAGEPLGYDPPPCRHCGRPHVLAVEEVVVGGEP